MLGVPKPTPTIPSDEKKRIEIISGFKKKLSEMESDFSEDKERARKIKEACLSAIESYTKGFNKNQEFTDIKEHFFEFKDQPLEKIPITLISIVQYIFLGFALKELKVTEKEKTDFEHKILSKLINYYEISNGVSHLLTRT